MPRLRAVSPTRTQPKPSSDSGLTPALLVQILRKLEAVARLARKTSAARAAAAVLPAALHDFERGDVVVVDGGDEGVAAVVSRATRARAVFSVRGSLISFAAGLASASRAHTVAVVTPAREVSTSLPLLRLAAKRKLPLIVVALRSNRGGARNFQPQLLRLPLPGITVDGNDPVAVYRVAREAIFRARYGDGPALLDCVMDVPLDGTKRRGAIRHLREYLRERRMR